MIAVRRSRRYVNNVMCNAPPLSLILYLEKRFQMISDFSSMTKIELRTYVIAHPDDKTAFHAFIDRFTPDASTETYDILKSKAEVEEVEILIRRKLEQLKIG